MTKRGRTILFSVCVALFLLIAPAILFYSQGYRFDFDKKKFSQTGGFYFKVRPQTSQIYIDNKLKKKTDLFFGTVFIKNLLPKNYSIRIQKDGFYPWQKTLEIKEEIVTSAKNIVLMPQNLNFTSLTKNVSDFFFSPNGKEIILKKNTGESWYLTLFDIEKSVESVLLESKKLSRNKSDFINLSWSNDLKKIVLEASINEQESYFLLDLESSYPLSPTSLDFLKGSEKFSFSSQNAQKIFFLKNGSIFEGDYKTKEISKPILNKIITFEISNGALLALDSTGFLVKSDFLGKNQEKINKEPFSIEKETNYQLFPRLPDIFLKQGNSLFIFRQKEGKLEKIFEPVNQIAFSSDSKKLMFFNDNEIWIYYLDEILDQPSKKAGELQLVTRFSEKISQVFWLTSHYLIFNLEGKIKVAEIDDRDKIQIWDLSQFQNPKMSFNNRGKKLYLLSEGNFYSLEEVLK